MDSVQTNKRKFLVSFQDARPLRLSVRDYTVLGRLPNVFYRLTGDPHKRETFKLEWGDKKEPSDIVVFIIQIESIDCHMQGWSEQNIPKLKAYVRIRIKRGDKTREYKGHPFCYANIDVMKKHLEPRLKQWLSDHIEFILSGPFVYNIINYLR